MAKAGGATTAMLPRVPPRFSKSLVVAGMVLLLCGLVQGIKSDMGIGRKLKQGSDSDKLLTTDMTVVTVPLSQGGSASAAVATTTTTQTTKEGAAVTTTTTTMLSDSGSSTAAAEAEGAGAAAGSADKPTASGAGAKPSAEAGPGATDSSNTSAAGAAEASAAAAAALEPKADNRAGNTPATAYTASALPSAADGGFYANTQTAGAQQHETLSLHIATQRKGMTIPELCTHEQSASLAQEFKRLLRDVPFFTACGDHAWMDDLNKVSPEGPKVMMDIGCNKGYTSAKMFGLWAPEVGFNPKAIAARRPEVWCGNCGDCQEEVEPALQASDGGLTVYCMEPSQANFAQLIITRDLFFKTNTPSVQWLTMNLAMSNSTGVARFSRECTSEQCALNVASKHNHDLIDTSTLDDFLRKHDIPHVHVLKIDTEGFDAAVLTGAMSSIAAGRVGVISFEYHEVGVWREYRLKHIVEWLAGFGYVCYFDGKGSVARLTGCWDEQYEIYEWSNVVCVPRSSPLYEAAERRSLRYQKMPEVYGKQQATASVGSQKQQQQQQADKAGAAAAGQQ